jgi:hypothetical protein
LSQGEGGGRPTKYKSAYCKIAKQLSKLGATDFEIAQALGIERSTFYLWMQTHPKFSDSVKLGKSPANRRTERSLFERANGYTYPSEEIHLVDEVEERHNPDDVKHPIIVRTKKVLRVPVLKHVPPDPTSVIFFLKNREKQKWRDFKATELSTPPGRPLETRTYAAGGPELLKDYYAKLQQSAEPAPAPVGADSAAPRDLGSDGSDGEEPYGDQDVSPR